MSTWFIYGLFAWFISLFASNVLEIIDFGCDETKRNQYFSNVQQLVNESRSRPSSDRLP